MKSVSELLRHADPVNDDTRRIDEARDRMRRTVVAAASVAASSAAPAFTARRVALGGVVAVAATVIVSMVAAAGNRNILQAAVRFEVRLAEAQPVPGLLVARVVNSGDVIYLHPETIVTNDDILQSWVVADGSDGFGVSVELSDTGAHRMRQVTATHAGKPLAIIVDGQVITAPIVRSPIGNSALISGRYTRAEADRIAEGIAVP